MKRSDWQTMIKDAGTFDEKLRIVCEALNEYPDDYDLLIMKGDFIQLADDSEYDLEEAKRQYEQALSIDPARPEACASLGYFHYAILDDDDGAELWFRKSLNIRPTAEAVIGVAKILLDRGKRAEAVDYLNYMNRSIHDRTILSFIETLETTDSLGHDS